jgi:hypothetical protein
MMASRAEGLTKAYNRLINANDHADDIVGLRNLHQELDVAVAASYGWTDLVFENAIRPHQRFGLRWLPSEEVQRDIELRLLQLNGQQVTGMSWPHE